MNGIKALKKLKLAKSDRAKLIPSVKKFLNLSAEAPLSYPTPIY